MANVASEDADFRVQQKLIEADCALCRLLFYVFKLYSLDAPYYLRFSEPLLLLLVGLLRSLVLAYPLKTPKEKRQRHRDKANHYVDE